LLQAEYNDDFGDVSLEEFRALKDHHLEEFFRATVVPVGKKAKFCKLKRATATSGST
jgi:hypothetical protein